MKPDTPSPVVAIRENKIVRTPLMEAVRDTQEVAARIKAKDFGAAIGMRDAEFKEYHRAYLHTATPEHPKLLLPENKVRLAERIH